jgi:hypothetical protein
MSIQVGGRKEVSKFDKAIEQALQDKASARQRASGLIM